MWNLYASPLSSWKLLIPGAFHCSFAVVSFHPPTLYVFFFGFLPYHWNWSLSTSLLKKDQLHGQGPCRPSAQNVLKRKVYDEGSWGCGFICFLQFDLHFLIGLKLPAWVCFRAKRPFLYFVFDMLQARSLISLFLSLTNSDRSAWGYDGRVSEFFGILSLRSGENKPSTCHHQHNQSPLLSARNKKKAGTDGPSRHTFLISILLHWQWYSCHQLQSP